MLSFGENRRYYALDTYLQNTFGQKVYKLALDGGMSCPNRDGTLGTGGCIFCSAGGSGDFAASRSLSVTRQIDTQIAAARQKTVNSATSYIAYFQTFSAPAIADQPGNKRIYAVSNEVLRGTIYCNE